MNYKESIDYIMDIPKFTSKNKAGNTLHFLELLDVDCNKMKFIHVAGTNGKGTVCAYISNILVLSNKRTGLFISPHLIEVNERIRINNCQINNDEFLEAFRATKSVAEIMVYEGYSHPSFFEFLFGMAMYTFMKKEVEYVVLEVGLGGRLDATNVIEHPIVSVITSIGLDHMEYLGDTIDKIAYEKAGIIKPGTPVVYWGENKIVSDVISKVAKDKGCDCTSVSSKDYKIIKKTDKSIDFCSESGYYLNDIFSVPFIAQYQVDNAVVALRAIEKVDVLKDNSDAVHNGFSTVHWEGRMENVMPGVIFDGAHNGPGIDEFIKTFTEYSCSGKKIVLFSVVKDKDFEYMVSKIAQTDVDRIFVTHIDSFRGLEDWRIAEAFEKYNCRADITVVHDAKEALSQAIKIKKMNDVLFCVGSLYLIGELKQYISISEKEENND